jgi:hypothetical protein
MAVAILAGGLALTPAASADPDHRATLGSDSPTFTWEGWGSGAPDSLDSGLRCTGAPFECDYVLLDVETAGELTLTLDGGEGNEVDDPTGAYCGDSPCANS